jgi:Na+/melibiose symporter-like transporter
MADSIQKLGVKEKVGYAVGDVATNFFFQSMILYQTRFYTDTVGLSAVAVGSMFLVLRLADAVFDPIIGALSDRTQTRWGRFRPWILFTAVPFGLIFWLVYVTPNVDSQGKLFYAYITYSLVMMLYSANNTPYSALMGVMTPDASERNSIASFRFVAALVGQFIIQALPLPLVAKLGHGDSDILFALKAGLSLGGALSAWIIAAYGYVPNVAQTAHTLLGIRLAASIYAAIPFVLGLLCLAIYPITKELNIRIQDELTERRKRYAVTETALA